jgi:uncharacterized protein YegJ (DUF2314 family)
MDKEATALRKLLRLLLFCLVLCSCQPKQPALTVTASPDSAPTPTVLEARKGFQTKLTSQPDWTPSPAPEPPPELLKLVEYPSPAGDLAAYVTPDPGDGQRHPAVVWCHGGFGGIDSWFWESAPPDDDQSASAFREVGLVLMLPSWRGENDNPGEFELFYGEVDDVLAALAYVKTLPYVDPDRVYLAGHSTGGTLVLLAAASTDEFRAAFSFGGAPDMEGVLADGGYGNTPFDINSQEEARLRSPQRFVGAIERPTFYFEGEDSYGDEALAMQARARELGVPFRAFVIEGQDHWSILQPLTRLLALVLLEDSTPQWEFEFTQELLQEAILTYKDSNFIMVPDDDPEMQAAQAEARANWPTFLELFAEPEGREFQVKASFVDGDIVEHMWVMNLRMEGDELSGTLGNEPFNVKNIKYGDPVRLKPGEVTDWSVTEGERTYGEYTVKVLRNR